MAKCHKTTILSPRKADVFTDVHPSQGPTNCCAGLVVVLVLGAVLEKQPENKQKQEYGRKVCVESRWLTRQSGLLIHCILELQTASIEELQKMKLFQKLLKKQEKELKELERKGSKRREELLQRYLVLFPERSSQSGKWKMCSGKIPKKKRYKIVQGTTLC